MKKNIHPEYHQAVVTCSCGNTFTVGSTVKEIHTELCSLCHPFYTGQQKLVDTAGRVERFRTKMRTAEEKKEKEKTRRRRKAEQVIGVESVEEPVAASKEA